MPTSNASLESVFAALSGALPEFSQLEQRVGLELYRQLAGGRPVRFEELAPSLGLANEEIIAALRGGLNSLVYYDDAGHIIGFGGLAVVKMAQRLGWTLSPRTVGCSGRHRIDLPTDAGANPAYRDTSGGLGGRAQGHRGVLPPPGCTAVREHHRTDH